MANDTFKSTKDDDYIYSEKELITHDDQEGTKYLTIKDGENLTHIQEIYYKFFKQLGLEFKFTDFKLKPIGLFKDSEWVGMVLPMRVIKDGVEKTKTKADFNKNELDTNEVPF